MKDLFEMNYLLQNNCGQLLTLINSERKLEIWKRKLPDSIIKLFSWYVYFFSSFLLAVLDSNQQIMAAFTVWFDCKIKFPRRILEPSVHVNKQSIIIWVPVLTQRSNVIRSSHKTRLRDYFLYQIANCATCILWNIKSSEFRVSTNKMLIFRMSWLTDSWGRRAPVQVLQTTKSLLLFWVMYNYSHLNNVFGISYFFLSLKSRFGSPSTTHWIRTWIIEAPP